MSITILVAATFLVFGTFAAALTFAQWQARGIIAPGARSLD